MTRKKRSSLKEPVGRRESGMAHLLSALHQNAAAVVNTRKDHNGPDQVVHGDDFFTSKTDGFVKLRIDEFGLGSEEPVSIPSLFRNTAESYPESIAMKAKKGDSWLEWTYQQYYEQVELISEAYLNLGLERHHSVVILGQNSPEWAIASLAATFCGAVSVGLPAELRNEDIARVAMDSKADIFVVEDEVLLQRILQMHHRLPDLRAIVQMKGEMSQESKRKLRRSCKKHVLSWHQLFEIGHDARKELLDDRLEQVAVNECCCLDYSLNPVSGPLKGIMFSQDNMTWCSKMLLGFIRAPGFIQMPNPGEEVLLSFIPLSSTLAQALDIYYSISVAGTTCFYGEDLSRNEKLLLSALAETKPSVLFAPSGVYEMIFQKIQEIRGTERVIPRMLCDWSSRSLRASHRSSMNKMKKWRKAFAKKAVCKKYKTSLGLGSHTVLLSFGDPISPNVLQFLCGYDIVVHESLGRPETLGLLAANIPKRYCQIGTAGKAVPGTKLKIMPLNEECQQLFASLEETNGLGEIGSYGRNLFMGYLNHEEEIKPVVLDGSWFKSGHIGYIEENGFLAQKGQIGDFILLKNGELIVPDRLEQMVRLELPCVRHAVLVGHDAEFPAMLLTLKTEDKTLDLTEEAKEWFKKSRFEVNCLNDVLDQLDCGLKHVIQAGIDRANQQCASEFQMIIKWKILSNPFHLHNGEIGWDGRPRRQIIRDNYAECVQCFYSADLDSEVCCREVDYLPRQPPLLLQLSQITEEDESKNSSRNSSAERFGKGAGRRIINAAIRESHSTNDIKEDDGQDATDETTDQKREAVTRRERVATPVERFGKKHPLAIKHSHSDGEIVGEGSNEQRIKSIKERISRR